MAKKDARLRIETLEERHTPSTGIPDMGIPVATGDYRADHGEIYVGGGHSTGIYVGNDPHHPDPTSSVDDREPQEEFQLPVPELNSLVDSLRGNHDIENSTIHYETPNLPGEHRQYVNDPYFQKYINEPDSLPIVGIADVSDEDLRVANAIVKAFFSQRQDALQWLQSQERYVHIQANGGESGHNANIESFIDGPYQSAYSVYWKDFKEERGVYPNGIAGNRPGAALFSPIHSDQQRNIFIHELAHYMHEGTVEVERSRGLNDDNPESFAYKLDQAFNDATHKNREEFTSHFSRNSEFVTNYATTNAHEYFSELAVFYFNTINTARLPQKADGSDYANSQEFLRDFDPEGFALVNSMFTKTSKAIDDVGVVDNDTSEVELVTRITRFGHYVFEPPKLEVTPEQYAQNLRESELLSQVLFHRHVQLSFDAPQIMPFYSVENQGHAFKRGKDADSVYIHPAFRDLIEPTKDGYIRLTVKAFNQAEYGKVHKLTPEEIQQIESTHQFRTPEDLGALNAQAADPERVAKREAMLGNITHALPETFIRLLRSGEEAKEAASEEAIYVGRTDAVPAVMPLAEEVDATDSGRDYIPASPGNEPLVATKKVEEKKVTREKEQEKDPFASLIPSHGVEVDDVNRGKGKSDFGSLYVG